MRHTARLTLGVIVVLLTAIILPRPLARVVLQDALAVIQVTPTIPPILGSPTPTEPGSGGGNEGGNGSGNNNNGGGNNNNGGNTGGNTGGQGDGKDGKDGKVGKKDGKTGDGNVKTGKNKKGKKNENGNPDNESIAGRIPGAFDTNKLVAVAAELRGLGLSEREVIARVYPPFFIAGPSSWIDTWGAPRYGPAPGQVRTHEGQDVFCDYGDPILAPEAGTVDFSNGGLGGIVARVHTDDGRYWYMAHLSDVNTEEFKIGDRVEVGDIVGYCGNSGNAITSPPHVHIGWYAEGGTDTQNPMRHLVNWLHTAERRVLGVVTKTTEKRVKNKDVHTAARMFGDEFTPDLSELRIASESLWASGSDPASGTFSLAQSVLSSALSGDVDTDQGARPQDAQYYIGAGRTVSALFDPDNDLAQLLNSAEADPEGSD